MNVDDKRTKSSHVFHLNFASYSSISVRHVGNMNILFFSGWIVAPVREEVTDRNNSENEGRHQLCWGGPGRLCTHRKRLQSASMFTTKVMPSHAKTFRRIRKHAAVYSIHIFYIRSGSRRKSKTFINCFVWMRFRMNDMNRGGWIHETLRWIVWICNSRTLWYDT